LVLEHLKVPHEVVNINTASKPDWFLARNPLGTLPVLEQGNKIVYGSAICNEYLEDLYGKHMLLPADPYEKARIKILMEGVSKITDKIFAIHQGSEENKHKAVDELQKAIEFYENKLSGKYLGGEAPNMLDFYLWPWIERFPMLDATHNVKILTADKFPKLTGWVKTMHQLPAVQATKQTDELHTVFAKSHFSGGPVAYDAGL
jgi:glutathione S-transferase